MERCARVILGLLVAVCPLFGQVLPPSDETEQEALVKTEAARYSRLMRTALAPAAQPSIDVKYYKLDLAITTSPAYLRGIVTVTALSTVDNLSSVALDLMNRMTVDSVKSGEAKLLFAQQAAVVMITLPRTYAKGEVVSLDVYYRGVPGSSGFGSFTFGSHSGTPWVYTLSEPYGAKDWWPCNDHPLDKADSVDIWVTADSSFKVGSNGKLVEVVNHGNGTKTHRWAERYPISTYLVSIAMTNFSEFTNWFRYAPNDSMPVLNYVLPEHLSSALAMLPKTVNMLGVFSDRFCLYPFVKEKYGHAEFGWGGGMEHQTMTSINGFSEGLVAHELAHMWFGDMITCANWPNIWLNEGFATYSVALYNEATYGIASYRSYMNNQMNSARTTNASLYVRDTNSVGTLFSSSLVYAKGACVLHMLRHVLGDSTFFSAMRSYSLDPRFRFSVATTEDFRQVCETVSGTQLKYFFDEWVYGERYPRYTYAWQAIPDTNGGYIVSIRVQQTTATMNPQVFIMPIDFRLTGPGLDTTVVLFNDRADQTFRVHIPILPTVGQLDPDNWILKTVTYVSSEVAEQDLTPASFKLEQNYPNPFNPTTVIDYTVGGGRDQELGVRNVRLGVYDLLGREVAILVDENMMPGFYSVEFNAKDLPSGAYLYRMTAGAFVDVKKLVVLK